MDIITSGSFASSKDGKLAIKALTKGMTRLLFVFVTFLGPGLLFGQGGAEVSWQKSWTEFVSSHNKCVRDVNCKLDEFAKKVVVWEGTIQALDREKRLVNLEIASDPIRDSQGTKANPLVILLRLDEDQLWKWKNVSKSARIRFRGSLPELNLSEQLVNFVDLGPEKLLAIFTLNNCDLVGIFPESGTGPLNETIQPDTNEIAEQMALAINIASGGASAGFNPILALSRGNVNTPRLVAARKNVRDAAAEVTGSTFIAPIEVELQFALIQWMTDRPNLGVYPVRARKISKQLLKAWENEILRISDIYRASYQYNDTHILFSIIFNDRLWSGTDWKSGNPEQALARLTKIPKDTGRKWAEVSNTNGLLYAAPNSLITVDSLFIANDFQIDLFNNALPTAKTIVNTPAPTTPATIKQVERLFEDLLADALSKNPTTSVRAWVALHDFKDPRKMAVFRSFLEHSNIKVLKDVINVGCKEGTTDPQFMEVIFKILNGNDMDRANEATSCIRAFTSERRAIGPIIKNLPPEKKVYVLTSIWLEKMTGVKFETGKEWQEWWLANKDNFPK